MYCHPPCAACGAAARRRYVHLEDVRLTHAFITIHATNAHAEVGQDARKTGVPQLCKFELRPAPTRATAHLRVSTQQYVPRPTLFWLLPIWANIA